MSSHEAIRLLFKKYAEGTISRQEQVELAQLLEEYNNDEIYAMLQPAPSLMDYDCTEENMEDHSSWQDSMLQAIKAHRTHLSPVPVVRMPVYRRPVFRYAAAAVVIITCGLTAWLLKSPATSHTRSDQAVADNYTKNKPAADTSVIKQNNPVISKTISNKPVQQLPDACGLKLPGSKDNVVRISMTDDSVAMSIPRSWQYELSLPDGSTVLLNAASSITYPKTFSGDAREVRIEGEAYFIVAENSGQPFYVSTRGRRFAAQGTRFNINAYEKEVTVSAGIHDKSWTEGYFAFRDEGVEEIMSEMARWYDWKVMYNNQAGQKTAGVNGSFCRRTSEADALKELRSYGINFLKQGNEIVVL